MTKIKSQSTMFVKTFCKALKMYSQKQINQTIFYAKKKKKKEVRSVYSMNNVRHENRAGSKLSCCAKPAGDI